MVIRLDRGQASRGDVSKLLIYNVWRWITYPRKALWEGLKILALSRDADTKSPIPSRCRPRSSPEAPEYPADTHPVSTLHGPCRHLARRLVCQLVSQPLSKRSWVQDPPRSRLVSSPGTVRCYRALGSAVAASAVGPPCDRSRSPARICLLGDSKASSPHSPGNLEDGALTCKERDCKCLEDPSTLPGPRWIVRPVSRAGCSGARSRWRFFSKAAS